MYKTLKWQLLTYYQIRVMGMKLFNSLPSTTKSLKHFMKGFGPGLNCIQYITPHILQKNLTQYLPIAIKISV